MTAAVDLSIIIVNWNTCDLLLHCLESIQEIRDFEFGGSLSSEAPQLAEVIVVDNASMDNSPAEVAIRFPWVKLIVNRENLGFACANNQGIQMASGHYILLLNSDTLMHPGSLAALVNFMQHTPQAGACGPRLLNADGSLQHACHPMLTPGREFWRLLFLDPVYPRSIYPLERWDNSEPRPVEALKGACLLVRRAALDQVGLLDERYFMYTEEVDLCHRLHLAGWSLWYVPPAVVTHFGGRSSRQIAETMYVQLYRSKIQFYRKFGGDGLARLAKLLYTVAYAPRWLAAAALAQIRPEYAPSARAYHHLLIDLPGM